MKSVVTWWSEVWFSRFDPLPLAVFRISFGLLLAAMFIAIYPAWERYYAADGILSLLEHDLVRPAEDRWSVFYWTEGIVPVKIYWWVGLGSALAFLAGWHTRFFTIVLYVLQSSMIHRTRAVVNGEDLVFRMLLFYSCFAPLGACLSVDRRRSRRRAGASHVRHERSWPLIWPVRLMQVNFALIYLLSLCVKLMDSRGEWIRGEAMYWSMMSNMWSRWPWPKAFYLYGGLLSYLTTYGTILAEAAFGLLVWFRRPKLIVIGAIALLHLGIAATIPNVTFFTLSMICGLWLFVPVETIRRIWAMGAALNRRGRNEKGPAS